ELHARKPTRVNVVADLGTKTIFHARPAVQIHACHSVSVVNRRKSMGNADEPDTSTRSDTTQGTEEGQELRRDRRAGRKLGEIRPRSRMKYFSVGVEPVRGQRPWHEANSRMADGR